MERRAVVTPMARTLPDWMCDSSVGMEPMYMSMRPPSRSGMACAMPRNGTCVNFTLELFCQASLMMCEMVPVPGVAKLRRPGSFLAAWMMSSSVL
ncbi:hypothetical protein D3C71_1591100 [compost metagenome]